MAGITSWLPYRLAPFQLAQDRQDYPNCLERTTYQTHQGKNTGLEKIWVLTYQDLFIQIKVIVGKLCRGKHHLSVSWRGAGISESSRSLRLWSRFSYSLWAFPFYFICNLKNTKLTIIHFVGGNGGETLAVRSCRVGHWLC